MNAFERKMAEQLALISTLVFDINRLSTEFVAVLGFEGKTKSLIVRLNEIPFKPFPKMLGNLRVYYILTLETYLDELCQELPFNGCCTTEQIIYQLHQIRQALIEGRSHDEHYPATDFEHTATTGVDERNGTHGALLTKPAQFCHGSAKRTGGQSSGAAPSMA